MFVLVIVQIMTIAILFLFGYLILKKEQYELISGFAMKSEEEQQELIKKGYPQAQAKGLICAGYILLAGLLLELMNVRNAILISLLVMTVFLFAYLLYITKLDVERTRKRNVIILIVTMVFTFAIVGGVVYVGAGANELTVSDEYLHISGGYGVDWPLEEVTNVELVEQLPKIQMRMNGYSLGQRLKGRFRLEELGNGRLFLYRDHPPFVFIEKGEDFLFSNSKDEAVTIQWYETAKSASIK